MITEAPTFTGYQIIKENHVVPGDPGQVVAFDIYSPPGKIILSAGWWDDELGSATRIQCCGLAPVDYNQWIGAFTYDGPGQKQVQMYLVVVDV